MLLNYLKIAFRNLVRYKSFSIITILGLTLGFTAFLAITLYVVDEFSYDRYHENADRIYRAVLSADFDGQTNKWGAAPNMLVPATLTDIPEVEKAARYFHHNFGDLAFISTEKEKFSETNLFFADPALFEIFTIPFVKGDASNALSRPGTVVLSEQAATKYFGDVDPVGQLLFINNTQSLEVTGVYKNFPPNSSLQANLIASFSSNWFAEEKNQSWGNASFDSYFLLREDATQQAVDEKIDALLKRHIPAEDQWFSISLQALTDMRLKSGDMNASFDRRSYGDYGQVKILSTLAIIILLIAAVNYMNLTTAQSQRRNKEVGISKTLGATHAHLSGKFFFEAFLFILIAMVFSLVLFTLFLPVYSSLTGKLITMSFVSTRWFWIGFALLAILLTLASGSYPAWYLSSFSPKAAIQTTATSGRQVLIRKGLVVIQFAVSMILIVSTLIFYRQMHYIQQKKLGYEPEQVLAIMTTAAKDGTQIQSLKTEVENLSDVVSVARAQSFPGKGTSMRNIVREGETGDGAPLYTNRATAEILDVMNIALLAGKTLPETKDPGDTTIQVVLNKAGADYLGLTPEEAIGKWVNIQGFYGATEVVGVMEDFHFNSLHQKIGAFCFHNSFRTEGYNYLLVKVNTENLSSTVQQLESVFKKTIASPFDYTFLDQHLDSLYRSEQNLAQVVLLFSVLAIIIACLGLYALAAYTAEQRTKEIGIRKVMGASVPQLVSLLSREFMILVLIAIGVGIPAGYYLMDQWLQGFAYKTTISLSVFVVAGLISVLIAWLTVSYESIKAALANPTKSLRNE